MSGVNKHIKCAGRLHRQPETHVSHPLNHIPAPLVIVSSHVLHILPRLLRAAKPAHWETLPAEMKKFCCTFWSGLTKSGGAIRYPNLQPVMA